MTLSHEGCETDLSRFIAFKQGYDFFFHNGEPLSIIFRETILFNEFKRRWQIFFDPPTIDCKSQFTSAGWTLADKRQSSEFFVTGFAAKFLSGESS